ncbi:hypothetical protein LTR10_014709 [Elasticomyces elasticus]|uniref:Uncharacterized protein n=1 Tax=Exophiala sideris TaxID=1016849 RepID=A0ABR0J6U6_9EURO|nr:hypothetical protein LTR10_014709 [Elasticomyces elasticus]KAK5029354.1 hypothetical protein LTS07_005816 [Exophiala sideris]KAK5036950.1 hypothetical protein LTR13_005330 [Exophiala sideris]KAK5057984.1 hypothetical protein LTR69_006981 [Exophiala sideris]KAK5181943.1 hypothetical protein LTR44_005544 [Eurotiomycetes sp. CCFEE 6388]
MEANTVKESFETKGQDKQSTESMKLPIPIILCGKAVEMGEMVSRLIQPELQVIHFINTFEDAKADLGSLVAGHGPKSPSSNHIGTHDYSKPPRAVIFGRGYSAAHVKELNHLFRGKASHPIAWIAGDPDVKSPTFPPGQNYAEKAADNVKRAFAKWSDAGGVNEDLVYY